MSADRISCTGQICMESETFETNAASGNSCTRVFTGSKALLMQQRGVELFSGATMTKLESTGDGNYKLTSGYNFDYSLGAAAADRPINAHELEIEMEQVDVWNSPVMRAQLLSAFGSVAGQSGALAFLKGKVDQWDAWNPRPDDAPTTIEAYFTATYAGAQLALMLNLFRGIAYHQIRSCPQFNPLYRRRITAASFNQINAAWTGAGQIWTTAEVVAFEGVPNSWWFTLPNKLWLKQPPSVNTVAGQKTEVVYWYTAADEFWNGNFTAYNSASLLSFYP